MENYDRHAKYDPYPVGNAQTSPNQSNENNDHISSEVPSTSNARISYPARKSEQAFKALTKLYLRRNSCNDTWHNVTEARSSYNPLNSFSNASGFENSNMYFPGPSTSGMTQRLTPLSGGISTTVTEVLSSDDSDSDCQIIGEVKPKSERTPEIIDILSGSDDDKTIDPEILSDSSSVEFIESKTAANNFVNNFENTFQESEYNPNSLFSGIFSSSSNHSSLPTKRLMIYINPHYNNPAKKISKIKDENTKLNLGSLDSNLTNQPIDLSKENEPSTSSVHSNLQSASLICLSDGSTDSYSETEYYSNEGPKKKLKLQSVVTKAVKSSDHSSHSSHKKKKEKKKKKKKHSHKHKRRIISDSD